jgi:hypothetical protein
VGSFVLVWSNVSLADLGLDSLLSIDGNLHVITNEALASLDGLSTLTTVGGTVAVENNPLLSLEEIAAFLARLGF